MATQERPQSTPLARQHRPCSVAPHAAAAHLGAMEEDAKPACLLLCICWTCCFRCARCCCRCCCSCFRMPIIGILPCGAVRGCQGGVVPALQLPLVPQLAVPPVCLPPPLRRRKRVDESRVASWWLPDCSAWRARQRAMQERHAATPCRAPFHPVTSSAALPHAPLIPPSSSAASQCDTQQSTPRPAGTERCCTGERIAGREQGGVHR